MVVAPCSCPPLRPSPPEHRLPGPGLRGSFCSKVRNGLSRRPGAGVPFSSGHSGRGPPRSRASLYGAVRLHLWSRCRSGSLDQSRGATAQLRKTWSRRRRGRVALRGRGLGGSQASEQDPQLRFVPRRSLCCTPGRAWQQAERAAVGLAADRLDQAHVEMRYAGAQPSASEGWSTLEGPSRVTDHLAAEAPFWPGRRCTPSGWGRVVTAARSR